MGTVQAFFVVNQPILIYVMLVIYVIEEIILTLTYSSTTFIGIQVY
ncbi:hypothetical protein HDC33_000370 [Sporosarcina sp. JAI121]|nr:hypothetical protein [Sporosarcina sp. JAI121]